MYKDIKIDIENYYSNINLDLRKSKNEPRFIDQKCTPDVLSFVADCILNINIELFNRFYINESDYFKKNVELIFGKPNPNNKNTNNEYDKFIGQQLELLSYAKILIKVKEHNKNNYKINKDAYFILEYISLKPTNAYNFLIIYIRKVLLDSNFYRYVEYFLKNQTTENFNLLKENFEKFLLGNSKIGTRNSKNNGKVEIDRIFPKVVNVLFCNERALGSIKGRISKNIITFNEDLVYNKINFRDKNKLKSETRKNNREKQDELLLTNKYNEFLIKKAMNWVKKHHPMSEVQDNLYGKTAEIHHIFPKSKYKEISTYIENLIALTAGQHKDKAHPQSNGKEVNIEYQSICLLSKLKSIEKDLKENGGLSQYSIHNFIYVLSVGFNDKNIPNNLSFEQINEYIINFYKRI